MMVAQQEIVIPLIFILQYVDYAVTADSASSIYVHRTLYMSKDDARLDTAKFYSTELQICRSSSLPPLPVIAADSGSFWVSTLPSWHEDEYIRIRAPRREEHTAPVAEANPDIPQWT